MLHIIYVTLPPEMIRIATLSLLGYSPFPKGGAILSSLAFQQNQFLQSFLHQKDIIHTQVVYKSVISKCLKEATLQ